MTLGAFVSGVYSQCAPNIYLGDVKLKNKLGRETKQICLLNHGLRHFVCFFSNFMETCPGHQNKQEKVMGVKTTYTAMNFGGFPQGGKI